MTGDLLLTGRILVLVRLLGPALAGPHLVGPAVSALNWQDRQFSTWIILKSGALWSMFQAHYGCTKTFVNSFILKKTSYKKFSIHRCPKNGATSLVIMS